MSMSLIRVVTPVADEILPREVHIRTATLQSHVTGKFEGAGSGSQD